MSAKKWMISLAFAALLVAALVAGFNILVDPFGVFGDPVLNWYSLDETNNPRVAKIAYLDQHYEEYNSYIIGCSSASSYPVDELNEYLDANFYNLFMYGRDMYDIYETAVYVIEHYNVTNLLINIAPGDAEAYNHETDAYTNNLHAEVDGSSKLLFYLKYAFANPQYSIAKLQDYASDTYLPQAFDVFDEKTGAYDKSARDVEPIGDLSSYLETNTEFSAYTSEHRSLDSMDECLAAMSAIRELCDERGIHLMVALEPLYISRLDYYDMDEISEFLTRLADCTDYWSFSFNSVCSEPRYFYDVSHFRNAAGTMALARMFGDSGVYVPDDYGVLVTAETVSDYVSDLTTPVIDADTYTAEVPILTYHNVAQEGDGGMTIAADVFEDQIKALSEAGYTGIFLSDLVSYVEEGTPLPDHPVVITFDDGYLSNYTIAFPILERYGMKATIFAIGVSMGKDTYKNTEYEIIPHFSYAQAAEMEYSGLIQVQSHTYDMHQWADYEDGAARDGVLQLDGESESSYIAAFRADVENSVSQIKTYLGSDVYAFAYPNGKGTTLTEALLREMGFSVTLCGGSGTNTIVKGLPQSLFSLKRNTVTDSYSGADLIAFLASF